MNLSVTPKVHILLNHAADQLVKMGGFTDVGEDHLEQAHQAQMEHETRVLCQRNIAMKMKSQAKVQGMEHIHEVKTTREGMAKKRKRNLKRDQSLHIERELEKKA